MEEKYLTLDELHQVHLDILVAFDSFCKENNIKYFLAFGTLIGAVRHDGFIPWDDDIDVLLPRPDYERLLQFNRISEKYEIVSFKNDHGYYHPFTHGNIADTGTIMIEHEMSKGTGKGTYLDLFPLDGLPDDYRTRKKHCKKLRIKRAMLNYAISEDASERKGVVQSIKNVIRKLCKLFVNPTKIALSIEKQALKYGFDESELVGPAVALPMTIDSERLTFKKEDFIQIDHIFAGKMLQIPKGFDRILSTHYGDYMTPPPEKDQVLKHHIDYIWKESSTQG